MGPALRTRGLALAAAGFGASSCVGDAAFDDATAGAAGSPGGGFAATAGASTAELAAALGIPNLWESNKSSSFAVY